MIPKGACYAASLESNLAVFCIISVRLSRQIVPTNLISSVLYLIEGLRKGQRKGQIE